MYTLDRLPKRLNGYDIIAVVPKMLGDGKPDGSAGIMLGHDATRRHGKYVTAYVELNPPPGRTITEWFWGHYTEDLEVALKSMIERASINTAVEITHAPGTVR